MIVGSDAGGDLWLIDASRLETAGTARKFSSPAAPAPSFRGRGLRTGTASPEWCRTTWLARGRSPSGTPRAAPSGSSTSRRAAGLLARSPVGFPTGAQLVARSTAGVAVVDTESGERRIVAAAAPNDYLSLSHDGKRLVVEHEVLDSDIWLLEFR